jgi:hypothetical protein
VRPIGFLIDTRFGAQHTPKNAAVALAHESGSVAILVNFTEGEKCGIRMNVWLIGNLM